MSLGIIGKGKWGDTCGRTKLSVLISPKCYYSKKGHFKLIQATLWLVGLQCG